MSAGLVILHDAATRSWLRFEQPIAILSTRRIEEVLPCLREVDLAVQTKGYWAAGFISYEAAPAFDPSLATHSPGELPLVWFGLYLQPKTIELPVDLQLKNEGKTQWMSSISRAAYNRAIRHIKAQIACGNTYQVNFTYRLRAQLRADPWNYFLALQHAQSANYGAFLDLGRYAICCASPELFFRLDGETITSRPMKGTARRGPTYEADQRQADWLYQSEKNRAENVMIVDMIRNDLGRIARTGSVHVDQLFQIERYPTLWQMTSSVSARTEASLPDILAALFPCASITGAPKISTMRIIYTLEAERRQIYTGCIGFIAPDHRAQLNVAIRTVWIDRETGQAEYGVGGGIVWDSTAADEYEECQTKASLLTSHRPPFQLLETCLWRPGEGLFLEAYHLKRMGESARYFGFPFNQAAACRELEILSRGMPPEPHLIRLLLDETGQFDCQAIPLKERPAPSRVRLQLAERPIDSGSPFLYHKTTHRQVYQAFEFDSARADDVLLWNERGELTETRIANLIIKLDGAWLTPPVESGLLAGTYRAWMLDQGLVKEQVLRIDDLRRASEIAVINAVRKQRPAILVAS